MKFLLTLLATTALFFTSCKKDDSSTNVIATVDMKGTTWSGPAKTGPGGIVNVTVELTFNADGTITGKLTSPASYDIAGTWNREANSNTVNMSFTVVSSPGAYIGKATLNAAGTKLENGTVINSANTDYNITFNLTKM